MKPLGALGPSKSAMEAPPPAVPGGPTGGGAPADPRAEERELVRRAQGGDERAFRRLVEVHGDRAYALALRIVRSPSDAEEVAQDALVRAWRSLPRFRGESAFSSWLYRIVVRRAYDRAALLKGRRSREAGIEDPEALPAAVAGPDAGARELSVRLERLVAELPEVPRTVVTLYYYQDRSVAEVASILRMPENTVKTHLSRARERLRTGWTDTGGGES
ncbi:MAG TPA: RNA polymerase sigma factor [Candidatus Eisenbacteria bacterium]|nr:RNA polymerase sigma factor [Candidatus Eisenbacteria bacterium]